MFPIGGPCGAGSAPAFPLRYLHNRKPMLITSELRAWMTSAGEAKTGETPRPDGWDGQKPL